MLHRKLECVFILLALILLVSLKRVASSKNPVREYAYSTPSSADYYADHDNKDTPTKNQISICGSGETCVRKCCPAGTYSSNPPFGCSNATSEIRSWEPPALAKSSFTILSGIPKKVESRVCHLVSNDEFDFKKDNGKVIYLKNGEEYPDEFYCIDNSYNVNTSEVSEFAVLCVEITKRSSFDYWADSFHKAGLGISSFCLVIILVLYATSPGKNDLKLQSKCMISSCVNLLIGFLLVLANMIELVTKEIGDTPCVILAISIQFFSLSFYFWLNVMIYDITRVISGTLQLHRLNSLEKKNIRYGLYALYGWGCPAVISIVTIIMQVESTKLSDSVIKPNIGLGRCWFPEKGGSIYAYYYGIEVFLHALNAGFVIYSLYLLKGEDILTTLNLRRVKSEKRFSLRNHSSKNHYNMFWQQFCTYIMYIFVWILNSLTPLYSREKIWRIVDIIVSLQGLFLLIIVVKFGENLVRKVFEKVSEAARTLTTSTSSVSLTELSSRQIQLSELPVNQQFQEVAEQ